jgi:hypothetical protein
MLDFQDILCLLIAFRFFYPFFYFPRYTAPPMDLQEYILSVINLIYRGCI